MHRCDVRSAWRMRCSQNMPVRCGRVCQHDGVTEDGRVCQHDDVTEGGNGKSLASMDGGARAVGCGAVPLVWPPPR
jgi:hypothetical protein